MSNIEKNLSGNLSTFFLNKNADMIPKNLSIIPKEKNSLWESLSKEILTPFSSKPNLYPNEKYLLKKKSQGITTQISSFDSIDNSIDNPQTAISFMTLNPKLDKLQSTKLKLVKNFNIKPFFLPLKSKKIFLKERVSRNLIFKKSHSINLEKSVNMSSENSKILKINLEKLKRIVIPKPKPNSSLMETMRKHSARVKNLVMSKNSIEIPKMKEVFRNRSCVCRYCGKNGKLEKNTTKFLKLHFPETNNSPNLKKIQSSAGIKKMMGSPLRKNVKSGESLKEFGCYELTNKRNSIILRCLKEENEIKPITLTMEKSKVSILTQKSIKNEENQKNQNSFILKKYKSAKFSKDNQVNIFNNLSKNFNHNEKIMSAEENQNLSEIIFQNGSDRTKKIMHANSIYFNGKLAVKNKITPYTSMKGKEMNLLIKNIWKIQ